MRWIAQLRMRIEMLFHRGTAAEHLDDELRYHLEREIAENANAGMSAEEARRAALRSFGNPVLVRDQARATWSWTGPELLLRDVFLAGRTLRRTPGFAAIAVVVMALGIGANVALFTLVRSVLLKPLPFADSGRLMRLYESGGDGKWPYNQNAGGVFAEWKRLNRTFTDMALCGYGQYNLSGVGEQLPESVRAATFSWNLLPVLGVRPALGRNFTADEDTPAANPTVLLSWGLWKRRFGGNPAIVGQTILLDAREVTVVGVMPAWFAFPEPSVQLWTPVYNKESPTLMAMLDDHDFRAIGRLKQGVTQAQAVADLSLITYRLKRQHEDLAFLSDGANIRPLLDSLVGEMKTPLYVLLAATGCVLLIACLNVANLLVARAAARRKEQAIRTALGGSRLRLLRQHLMESLLLTAAGGLLGLGTAAGVLQWFATSRPDMARSESIGVDAVVVAFTTCLVLACAAFAGLISSLSLRGDQALASLQESSRSHSSGSARVRLRGVLLSLEVGLTVVLLVGAGLLLKSYNKLRASDLGCLTANVLKMDLMLPEARYKKPAQMAAFFQALLTRTRAIHGVEAAGYIFPVVPGDGYGGDNGFFIAEHPPLPQGKMLNALHRWIDPGYFAAIGIPILRGHTLDDDQQPGHATQVVISNALARQFFPGEDPIGKHLIISQAKRFEVVGVVGDTRADPGEAPEPTMYFSLYAGDDMNGATLVMRSSQDVTRFALPIQRIVAEVDHDLPVSDILTMDQVIGRGTIDASFDAALLLVFAVLSLVLAAVGLFGVLSYLVAQRTSEIGIRLALGAQRGQVLRLMLIDGLRPALIGLALGMVASAGTSRIIRSMLYGTRPLDPAVFATVGAMLLGVGALACVVPAWRASRLDPMQALRTE
jgi:putative ABC transport system permease protein